MSHSIKQVVLKFEINLFYCKSLKFKIQSYHHNWVPTDQIVSTRQHTTSFTYCWLTWLGNFKVLFVFVSKYLLRKYFVSLMSLVAMRHITNNINSIVCRLHLLVGGWHTPTSVCLRLTFTNVAHHQQGKYWNIVISFFFGLKLMHWC